MNWDQIDHVFLDLDGTLLDLAFDNYFWQEYVPVQWAHQQAVSLEAARLHLSELTEQYKGQLQWYCLDFWSEQLKMDIVQLKQGVQHRVTLREHSLTFLHWLKETQSIAPVLVTNVHPKTLAVKFDQVPLRDYFELIVSSHQFQAPKEQSVFWAHFRQHYDYNPARTLFVDDTQSVLCAAQQAGIGHLLQVAVPDSRENTVVSGARFALLHSWLQLMVVAP